MRKLLLSLLGMCGLLVFDGCGGGGRVVTTQPLVITSAQPPSGIVDNAYAGSGFVLTASGGSGSYSWSWAAAADSSLPAGLALANATISGTPTAANTYNVVITVSDSQSPPAKTSSPYAIMVIANNSGLTISLGSLPSGVAGNIYNPHRCRDGSGPYFPCAGLPLNAGGGVPPYTWSWAAASGSSLPTGLVLQDGGTSCPWGTFAAFVLYQICGRPSTAGTYDLVLTVTDSASPQNQASSNFALDITNPPTPTINTSPSPAVGALNLPYAFGLTTTGGLKPLTWSETGSLPPGLTLGTDGTLSGTPTAVGSFPITAMVSDSLGRNASPQNITIAITDHGFKATGSMIASREFHTANLLPDGRVLVAGGLTYVLSPQSGPRYTKEYYGELFDPVSGSFSQTGYMTALRSCHAGTLLANGKILITGGDANGTADLFDPVTGFSATGSMTTTRICHTATLLTDGRVLIAGDGNTAELYDSTTGTFSSTGSMATARRNHTATLLQSGKVLVTGGTDNTAELYDPATGTFSSTGSMAVARSSHTATLLASGKVLVTGGADNSAELYDPDAGTFSPTGSMSVTRSSHTATLLNDGTVLVVGGYSASGIVERSAELFDPATGTFSATGSLLTARASHTATLLKNGTVLVTGGTDDGAGTNLWYVIPGILASTELYQ